MSFTMRKTKIVTTIGPATETVEKMEALLRAGSNVFRLNFSHGTHKDHRARFEQARALSKKLEKPLAIFQDLQGPKLRVGAFKDGMRPVLKKGAKFRMDQSPVLGDETRVCLPHPEIFAAARVGDDLLVDDGKVRVRIEAIGPKKDFFDLEVIVGGTISDHKGVNVPGTVLPISPLTPKDREDLKLGIELGVDYIALSFVQRPEDILEARALVDNKIPIISKIEKPAAIQHIEEIIKVSDAIMVARGDLGVEMPAEEVPVLQRRIIDLCRKYGRPVIVATQMLESMIETPTPTRAEASDVATAVFLGADAVMLSAESASGKYPIEAVTMMDKIIRCVEADGDLFFDIKERPGSMSTTIADGLCQSAFTVSRSLKVRAIGCLTKSGQTALNMSRCRPNAFILGVAFSEAVCHRQALYWGVYPLLVQTSKRMLDYAGIVNRLAKEKGIAKEGDLFVYLIGLPTGSGTNTNTLHISKL